MKLPDNVKSVDTIILNFIQGPFATGTLIDLCPKLLNDTKQLRCLIGYKENFINNIIEIINQLNIYGFCTLYKGFEYDYKYVGNFTGNRKTLTYISKKTSNLIEEQSISIDTNTNIHSIFSMIENYKDISDLDKILDYCYKIYEDNNVDVLHKINRLTLRSEFRKNI